MFDNGILIPICLLVIFIGVGLFYGSHIANQRIVERTTYDRMRIEDIIRHKHKYPDCQDTEAVFEDADRYARWYIDVHEKWKDVSHKLYMQWESINHEKSDFSGLSYKEMLDMTASERDAFVANLTPEEAKSLYVASKDWAKRRMAAFERYDEFYQNEPAKPKRQHTH